MMARLGAGFYFLWGLLHVGAALQAFRAAQAMDPGLIEGRLSQGAWNIGVFAIAAMVVAVTLNWRNSRIGYVINLAMVSAADIGFIIFVLQPGYVELWPSVLGPILWVLAAITSTLALRAKA